MGCGVQWIFERWRGWRRVDEGKESAWGAGVVAGVTVRGRGWGVRRFAGERRWVPEVGGQDWSCGGGRLEGVGKEDFVADDFVMDGFVMDGFGS